MKSNSEREKFVDLRANGISYDKISQELGISKPTLIKWGKECQNEISNRLYFDYESLLEEFCLRKKARLESAAIVLKKALDELRNRSLDNLSTKDLLFVIQSLERKIDGEVSSMQYFTGERTSMLDDLAMDFEKEQTLPFVY